MDRNVLSKDVLFVSVVQTEKIFLRISTSISEFLSAVRSEIVFTRFFLNVELFGILEAILAN